MFIWTGYGDLKKSEICHAFTLNYQGAYAEKYRHYNRELNAEFIGDVLDAYKLLKEDFFQRTGMVVMDILKPANNDLQGWKELIEHDYYLVKERTMEAVFYSPEKYIALRKMQFIKIESVKQWLSWMKFAFESLDFKTQNILGCPTPKFESIGSVVKGFTCYKDFRNFLIEARHIIYMEYLRACLKKGFENINRLP
jgi:hypothetical protein